MPSEQIKDQSLKSTPASTDMIAVDDSSNVTWRETLASVWQGAFNYIATLTAKTTLTGADIIPLNDSAASSVGKGITWTNFMGQVAAFTSTFTNKRIQKRVVSTAQSATPTINTDNGDIFEIVGLAQAITSMTTNLSGTPLEGEMIEIIFKDNATARAITWGASFVSSGNATLPTITVLSVPLAVIFQYRTSAVWTATSAWYCVGVA